MFLNRLMVALLLAWPISIAAVAADDGALARELDVLAQAKLSKMPAQIDVLAAMDDSRIPAVLNALLDRFDGVNGEFPLGYRIDNILP